MFLEITKKEKIIQIYVKQYTLYWLTCCIGKIKWLSQYPCFTKAINILFSIKEKLNQAEFTDNSDYELLNYFAKVHFLQDKNFVLPSGLKTLSIHLIASVNHA